MQTPDPTLYRVAFGSLKHLANGTRPDINYAVNTVSRAQSSPTALDWEVVLRINAQKKNTSYDFTLQPARERRYSSFHAFFLLKERRRNACDLIFFLPSFIVSIRLDYSFCPL